MTPSKNQSNAASEPFDSDAKKYLATKNDATLSALIDGIRDPDRADAWFQAEVELADERGRDPRKALIGHLNRKKTALQDHDD